MLVDWQMVCLKLRSHKPLSEVAKDVNCGYQNIRRLASGDVKDPRFNTGVRLLDYYYDHIGDMEAIKCK